MSGQDGAGGAAAEPDRAQDEGDARSSLTLNLDGTGATKVDTGIPFFNHMLEAWSKHG